MSDEGTSYDVFQATDGSWWAYWIGGSGIPQYLYRYNRDGTWVGCLEPAPLGDAVRTHAGALGIEVPK